MPNKTADLSLSLVTPSRHNMRDFNPKDPVYLRLKDSIAAHGVIQPIVVRNHPEKPGTEYVEIIGGEQRYRACKELGLAVIPVHNLGDVDDATAQALIYIENAHRRNLTKAELLAQIKDLAKLNLPSKELAAMLGEDHQLVACLLAFAKKASPRLTTVFCSGALESWPMGLWGVLTTLPHEEQNLIADDIENDRWGEFAELKKTSELITRYEDLFLRLDRVEWKLDDVTLYPKAKACTTCPHNSANQTDLFPSMKEGKKIVSRCCNKACFMIKAGLVFNQKIEAAKKIEGLVVADAAIDRISDDKNEAAIQTDSIKEVTAAEAAKDPANHLCFVDQKTKAIVYVKKTKAEAEKAEKAKPTKTIKQKREFLNLRRHKWMLQELSQRLEKGKALYTDLTVPKAVVAQHELAADLLNIAAQFECTVRSSGDYGTSLEVMFTHRLKSILQSIRNDVARKIKPYYPAERVNIDTVKAICNAVHHNYDHLLAEATTALPEPKAWSK